ncbi:hypothetical protein K501DRAFT_244139 [Backusella circina FSU 941]|nr:hypothetical protein K501DRAFT_244139 [Backusella circina FSU 941]
MAETVQYYLERMIPELEDLEKHNVFSKTEIKAIIKKRTNLEYALKRRIAKKIDFLRCIEYEMNVEELRKKRVERLGLKAEFLKTKREYSGVKRIFALFRRATTKFKGDVALWLQYIDYAKKSNSRNVLSSIFTQAIQYHPGNASLWIMAASWEHDQNANPSAARTLMQRSLRMNPENELLWQEYMKLELIYVEKIKIRRRVLGITDDAMDVDKKEEEEDDNAIQLPAITGEDVDDWNEESHERKQVKKLEDNAAEALKEGINPILQGLLAKIIYNNAIQALPNNFDFRKKCIEIYRQFLETDQLMDEAYETIRRDMNHLPEARAYLATRHLYKKKEQQKDEESSMLSISDPDFIPAFRLCIADFDLACHELPTSEEMWVHYIKFLLGWFETVNEENFKLYLSKLLTKTFKASEKSNALSTELYELWTKFLIGNNQKDKAKTTVKSGLKAYPHSTVLWIYRIEMAEQKEVASLYKAALELNADSFALWSSYNDWLLTQWQEEIIDKEETEQLYFKACESGALLLPSLQIETEDRNRIKDLIQKSFVKWAAQAEGVLYARQVYRKILLNFYPTYEFLMSCLEIENQYGEAKDGQEHVESLYDRIVRMANDKQGSYLSYLSYLYSQKKFQKANQVYYVACKEVEDREAFDIKVQALRQV